MASSSQKNRNTSFLFDPIRKKWVDHTPEESIRQSLIRLMIDQLGYPSALIAVEKELSQLPHLSLSKNVPKRRADLIVFAMGSLLPLMLIECKAVPLTPKFARQVIGYNAFVGAPFLVLANAEQVMTGSFDLEAGIHRFEPGLPSFHQLR